MDLFTIREAAVRLGVSPQTLRRWDRRGILPSRRHPVSGFRMYRAANLAAADPDQDRTLPSSEPLDSFVGRRVELDTLAERALEGARILTVVGAPGVGKTRLALQYARACAASAADWSGTWPFDLTEAIGRDDVCAAMASALGAPLPPDRSIDETIELVGAALRTKGRALFVLDNFEQAIAEAATLLPVFARRAPKAVFLVTSRERLRVEGESVFELGPMGTPASDDPQGLEASDAGQLFLERARAVGSFPEHEAASVCELIRQLDGLPLAIELAARRLGLLPADELLRHLSEGLAQMVGAGPRGVSLRRSSLQGAIDASWQMLTGWERSALAQCSIFRGGFTLEAARAVLDLGRFPQAPSVLDVLASLRDRSLLRRSQGTDPSAPQRLDLLLAIRDYATTKLREAGEEEETSRRHATYFLERAGRWYASSDGPDEVASRRALGREQQNLAAIHRRVLEQPEPPADRLLQAVEALRVLEPAAFTRGPNEAHRRAADRLVELSLAGPSPALAARALQVRSEVHGMRGDYAAAAADAAAALSLSFDDRALESKLRLIWGFYTGWCDGGSSQAVLEIERAVALRQPDDRTGTAVAQIILAEAHLECGALEQARRSLALVVPQLGALGPNRQAWFHSCLAKVQIELDELEGAKRSLALAASRMASIGHAHQRGVVLGRLASILHAQGDLGRAVSTYLDALPGLEEGGEGWRWFAATIRARLGAARAQQGELGCAATELDAAHRDGAGLPDFEHEHAIDRAHLALAVALRATMEGDPTALPAALVEARATVRSVQGWSEAQRFRPNEFDVRCGLRILESAIARLEPYTMPSEARGVVPASGAWFWRPGAPRVPLARTLHHLLGALAIEYLRSPGTAVSSAQLFGSIWPGDPMTPGTAEHRVRAAIARLRRCGLGPLIERTADGYRLAPSAMVLAS